MNYQDYYLVYINCIIGNYTVYNEGDKFQIEKEKNSYNYLWCKIYNKLPTMNTLIDDICIFDLLENESFIPIFDDFKKYKLFPTAKEFYEKIEILSSNNNPYLS